MLLCHLIVTVLMWRSSFRFSGHHIILILQVLTLLDGLGLGRRVPVQLTKALRCGRDTHGERCWEQGPEPL